MELTMEQLSYLNWETSQDGDMISLPDPMVYIEGLDMAVDTLTIKADMDTIPPQYAIFYINQQEEVFSGEKMVLYTPVTGNDVIELDMQVSAIRVDPGEDAGCVLHNISFCFNEIVWDISVSRIVAMLVICWGTAWLMSLQKSADYGIQ